MKVEELRIGNLALHEGEIKEVNEIGTKEVNEGVCGYLGFKSTRTMSWVEHKGSYLVNPIPLTEEWLVKFGFEETDNYGDIVYYALKGYGNRHYYFCFDHESISFGLSVFNNCTPLFHDDENLQHVHQLQNLYFALTGEELTIKN